MSDIDLRSSALAGTMLDRRLVSCGGNNGDLRQGKKLFREFERPSLTTDWERGATESCEGRRLKVKKLGRAVRGSTSSRVVGAVVIMVGEGSSLCAWGGASACILALVKSCVSEKCRNLMRLKRLLAAGRAGALSRSIDEAPSLRSPSSEVMSDEGRRCEAMCSLFTSNRSPIP